MNFNINIGESFRVKQISKEAFIVQKRHKKIIIKGYLWWKKKIVNEEWINVNAFYHRSLKSAKKNIKKLRKYPIYFYVKNKNL